MSNYKNLDRLVPGVSKKIEPYLNELVNLHGDSIRSIVVYGSGATKDFSLKTSDINLLVIFDKVNFDVLKKSLKLVNQGIKKKIMAPLFLSDDYMQASCDVFPIEFLDFKENHVLVYGEDLLASLTIDSKNLQLQCEEQIKGKLIRLQQAYLEVGLSRKGIEALLKESLKALLPVFRNLLRLKGKPAPISKESILKDLALEFGIRGDIFLEVLRDQQADEKIRGKAAVVFIEGYLDEMRKLAEMVDKL